MEYLTVGKIKDAHGLKGELYVLLFAKDAPWIKKLKVFQISKETVTGAITSQILTLKNAKPHKDGLIVSTQEVNDRNQSELLKGYSFEIPKKLLVSQKGETPYLIEILGFEVFDGENLVGKIVDFSSNTEQDLLVIESPTHFYEVPFVESYISKIDYDTQNIMMNIPEGLLELCGQAK